MKQPSLMKTVGIAIALFAALTMASQAQTFKVLANMDIGPGQSPLLQGPDGNFYGMDSYGGTNGFGSVFKMTPAGKVTIIYSFCSLTNCADGTNPEGGLIQGADHNYYGTTAGTVFKITPQGKLTTLYTFCSQANCADGTGPNGLVLATDGDFYGTTSRGGAAERRHRF